MFSSRQNVVHLTVCTYGVKAKFIDGTLKIRYDASIWVVHNLYQHYKH